MKNKKFIWILAPVVLLIWGLIFFQIKKAVSSPPPLFSSTETTPLFKKEATDTVKYLLKLNYDDPFLKNSKPLVVSRPTPSTAQRTSQKPKSKKPVVKKTVIKKPVNWPQISYRGMIKNKHQKSIYLIDVDGTSVFLNSGEEHDKVKLEAAFRDSVQLSFQNEKRTILKQ